MACGSFTDFLRCDRGGGTIFGLLWFILLVGITGLSVDITDGYRTQTMLQATADAAALGAAIDLPNQGQALVAAKRYAELNMPEAIYGQVLDPADVQFGAWDVATGTFNDGVTPATAVRVLVHRNEENDNALPVNFLRIIGLDTWNVSAASTASQFKAGCLGDGLLSRGIVDISSNNDFVERICIHGEQGVAMQQSNTYELGVIVSMPDPDPAGTMLQTPASGMDGNPGLAEALRPQSLSMNMIDRVPEFIAKFLDPSLDVGVQSVIPDFIKNNPTVIEVNDKFKFAGLNFTEGQGAIYHVKCKKGSLVSIPNNITLTNVTIVADCRIGVGSGAILSNVVLASSSTGKGSTATDVQNISFASNVQLGAADGCTPGGGVRIYSAASVHFSSTMLIHGLQTIAAGRVELGARDNGIHGISVQAGDDIALTSNNIFGLCSGGSDGVFPRTVYHLVQ